MEFELWYLVFLPLAFAAGWFGRGFESRNRASDHAALPRSYFRGLNLLLNDQHDKAIDAFIEVVRLDPETIELHHALGNLFRRRGEFDRAVRIHTHLFNRADLPARERSQALAELGQDYLKGGLLDRAEDAFTRLLEDRDHRFDALRSLLRIFEMEREWLKAIDCARRLEREAGENHQVAVAHFHCELAAAALAAGRLQDAQLAIDEALAADRKSVRALILAGDLAARRGEPEEALRLWQRVEGASREHLPLIAGKFCETLDQLGRRDEALNWLNRALLDVPSIDLLEVACARTLEWRGPAAAEALVAAELKRHPSLLGFERLAEARLALKPDDAELASLAGLLKGHARKLARYRCSKCGFRTREYHWHCPGCSQWDSYPPRRLEELDA
ncbi:MAG: lipopolysaccharide assembly protein LapB [Burkholderiaceae bacterium]|jgi:lipopolysaccharide biosynthesis regulator YciM|nr:lipopolysaccharide assembly protein LapB [Burkholderiaceae bacterium]